MAGRVSAEAVSHYWLRLVVAASLAGCNSVGPLQRDATELVAILTTIVKRLAQDSRA